MANQYTGSLEHKVKEKFGCSAEEILHRFAKKDYSYYDAEDELGVTHGTIRKWAKRLGIELKSVAREEVQENIIERFFAPEMNTYNFLSRKW